jgi:PhoPQ-activated pathogenicity-related protein
MLALIIALITNLPYPTELGQYLDRPDTSYSYKEVSANQYEMVSQTWKGSFWKHTVDLRQPKHLDTQGKALLIITGGKVNDADIRTAQELANQSGLPVATLFDIPNQPLYDKHEDDLIAYTFEQYIDTGEADWPLLFPMAKSALRAMDLVQSVTQNTGNPIKQFVVTGASKRGWTTWFVGASGDKRVIGIAPRVIDNLNVQNQMEHQMALWGHYSEMIEDYTRRGLQGETESGRGSRLSVIIDPYSYRSLVKVPTLIVNGTNDPYWATDALSLYWKDLRQPKTVIYVPNKGHEACDTEESNTAVAAFAHALAVGWKWPSLTWTFKDSSLKVKIAHRKAESARLWVAESDNLDFRQSKWSVGRVVSLPSDEYALLVPPSKRNQAFFGQVTIQTPTGPVNLCTQTYILKAIEQPSN